MNSIRVKSGSFEIEIQTDQPSDSKTDGRSNNCVVKAAPPIKTTQILDTKEATPALPSIDTSLGEQVPAQDAEHAGSKGTKGHRRKSVAKSNGDMKSRAPTAEDKIEGLIDAGKFDIPQALKDVHSMQERMALNYSKPRIANALAELVRKDKLERIGSKNDYKYVKKGVHLDQPSTANIQEKVVNAGDNATKVESIQKPSTQEMTLEAAIAQAQN